MLDDCIKEIRKDSSISTLNEANAKRRIIERILSLLGWNIYGPEITAEYGVGERRVDYALQINGEDEVFLEAKKPGEDLDNHQKQLLEYSFHEGVALAILTNGIKWWFYLPLKPGAWHDRRFHTLDLLAEDIDNIVSGFDRLLSRENVGSGKAVQHAESMLKRSQREEKLKESLPEAWNRVIRDSERDSLLVDLLKETTEEVCGFALDAGEVGEISQFIRAHQEKWILPAEPREMDSSIKISNAKIQVPIEDKQRKPRRKLRRMQINDIHYELKYVFEILVNTANWLIDKGNLQLSDCPVNVTPGKKRVLINNKGVHPSGSEFWSPQELKNGLYIECHASRDAAIKYSKRLLEMYGHDPKILQVESSQVSNDRH